MIGGRYKVWRQARRTAPTAMTADDPERPVADRRTGRPDVLDGRVVHDWDVHRRRFREALLA